LLEGLEVALPLLAEDIQRTRAEAARVVGPYAFAGEYFAARSTPDAQLKAADAFERAQNRGRAKAACDRAIALAKRTREQEAEARARRLRLFDNVDDARWLVVNAPDLPWAHGADAALSRLDPARPLTQSELVTRARILADAGRTEDAL